MILPVWAFTCNSAQSCKIRQPHEDIAFGSVLTVFWEDTAALANISGCGLEYPLVQGRSQPGWCEIYEQDFQNEGQNTVFIW